MKNTLPYVVCALVSIVAGAALYFAVVNAYKLYTLQGAQSGEIANIRALLSQSAFLRYATVESVDHANRILLVRAPNAYRDGTISLSIRITDRTVLARQHLTDTQGVYDSLSEITLMSLADIRPGDRIAYLARAGAADLIIDGDPL